MKSQEFFDRFYDEHPTLKAKRGAYHNQHDANTRTYFNLFVDRMERAGDISIRYAQDLTLDDDPRVLTPNERDVLTKALEHVDREDVAVMPVDEAIDELAIEVAEHNAEAIIRGTIGSLVRKGALAVYTMDVNGRPLKYLERGPAIEHFEN